MRVPCVIVCVLVAVAAAAAEFLVMPPPKIMKAHGDSMPLDASFTVTSNVESDLLRAAVSRYTSHITRLSAANTRTSAHTLKALHLRVASTDETLNMKTNYEYTLSFNETSEIAQATAISIYGAMYAMETFAQLIDLKSGQLARSNVHVEDSPDYNWRGLMLDSGRRFFPVDTLVNIMDTMAANKLNVLHLHASDECRFGVESKLYPNLTAALTGQLAGFYSQDDIRAVVTYASQRGIRVVPEFDIPGHSRGFIPIQGPNGVQFCEPTDPSRSQLYNDPQGLTYKTLKAVLGEMASLFPDDVLHIGCDETGVTGPCTANSTGALEHQLFIDITNSFGKTPAGWEEAFFDAGAATNNTIVYAWSQHNPSEIISTGRACVESSDQHFYFTEPGPAGPAGWTQCWYDISTGVPSSQLDLLLGGEMSMWTDTYCYIDQCGASTGAVPVGAALFNPANDLEFSQSVGGMIWPRGYVGAAAFWHYDASVNPSSSDFVSGIYRLNDQLAARGSYVCPSQCACDQLTACGKPYLPSA